MDWFKSDYDTIIHDYEPIEITLRQLLSSLSPIGKKRTSKDIAQFVIDHKIQDYNA